MAANASDKALKLLGRAGIGLGAAMMLCQDDKPYSFLFNVDGTQRAVMFNVFGGVSNKVYTQGTHFKVPWFMRPQTYDCTVRPKLIQTTTGTKDLQMVNIHLRVLFKPNTAHLPELHKQLGRDYDDRVLPSIGNEVLKTVVARYDASQLLTEREEVSAAVRQAIIERAKTFFIELDDVSITHLNYGKEFAKAIEEKQVALQDAERQKFLVQRTEQEKIATITRAEGEAEAAQMVSNALQKSGQGLIAIRRIEAAREIANTLSNAANVMYLPGSQNMLLNLNTGGGRN